MPKVEVRPLYRVRVIPEVKKRDGYHRRWIDQKKYEYWSGRGYAKVQSEDKMLSKSVGSPTEDYTKKCRELILVETPVENVKKHREMMDRINELRTGKARAEATRKGLFGRQTVRRSGKTVLDEGNEEDD